ncbi:MAG: sugar phosphate isomerase/epimerase family protein [Candidatus Bathyarchaeia archaeon]|nr:sugar phosphate isomerase/epimerase family protein [Candidatus Bathyarchaeia archaeon]
MVKPEIGLSMLYCLGETFQKMTGRLHKVETIYIELVDEGLHALNKRRVQVLKELADSYGLKYMVHAPFADINIASPSKPLLNVMLKRLKKSIINAGALNCQVWVFHPGLKTGISMFYPGMEWVQNLKTTRLLFRFASDHGVEVAIENVPEPYSFIMKSVEDFKRFYNEVNEDIGLVLDIGHANINGQIESFLTTFADKIVHMHAHDNYGKSDQHLGIGHGNINWKKTAVLIKSISYKGTVVVESIEHVEQSMSKLKRLLG